MHFTYYTDKTVSQCLIALNERIHTKSGLGGWTDKNGDFALDLSSTVMRKFSRTTRLQAKIERVGSMSVIKGHVSEGIDFRRRMVLFGLLVLAGVFLILHGTVLPGIVAIFAPLALNIPLEGDFNNSHVLLGEVQRSLKAKETPPVPAKKTPASATKTVARKPAPATTRKAAAPRKSTTS